MQKLGIFRQLSLAFHLKAGICSNHGPGPSKRIQLNMADDRNRTTGLLKRVVKRPKNGGEPVAIEICRMGKGWEHMKEQVVDYHMTHFVPYETINIYLGLMNDEESVQEMRKMWSGIYDEGISIAALTWGNDGPTVIGASMLSISKKGKKQDITLGHAKTFEMVGRVMEYFTNLKDVYTDFGVEKYLSGVGMSIQGDFRGMGLGEEILYQRETLCKELELTLDITLFTGPASQHLGRKCGYQTIAEVPYDSIEFDGAKVFPGRPGILLYTYKKMSLT